MVFQSSIVLFSYNLARHFRLAALFLAERKFTAMNLITKVFFFLACLGGFGAPICAQDLHPPGREEKPVKKLMVEWKHLDRFGQTCIRCSATGKTLVQVIDEMKAKCASQGIEVTFQETRLTIARLKESNEVLFNGVPLEKLLPDAKVFESDCPSCATLTGQTSCCRGVEVGQKRYEEIPEELIWQAACALMHCDSACKDRKRSQ